MSRLQVLRLGSVAAGGFFSVWPGFRANAQTPLALSAPAAYEAPPGTLPIGAVTGVFVTGAGASLPDFVVLEQNPNNAGVRGNAIAVGQFRAADTADLAVATNLGIVNLGNDGSGTFTLSGTTAPVSQGVAQLAVVGLAPVFNGAWATTTAFAPDLAALASGPSPKLAGGAACDIVPAGVQEGAYENFSTYSKEAV